MVELVRNDQTTLSNKGRDECGIGGEAHGADKSIFRADKFGDKSLPNGVQVAGAAGEPGATGRDAVSLNRFFDGIGTPAAGLSEAEVVVGGNVKGACAITSKNLGVIVVGGNTIQKNDGTTSYSGDGLGETLVQTSFKAAGIKRIKV